MANPIPSEQILKELRDMVDLSPFTLSIWGNPLSFYLREINPFEIKDFTVSYVVLQNNTNIDSFFVGVSANTCMNALGTSRIALTGTTLENNPFEIIFTRDPDGNVIYNDARVYTVIPVEDYNKENWVPVKDIIKVPIKQQINVPFLTATNGEVQPENASDLVITWEIDSAYPNDTRAQIIDNNIFMATIAGTAHVLLTVENGAAFGVAYTREFEIEIYG